MILKARVRRYGQMSQTALKRMPCIFSRLLNSTLPWMPTPIMATFTSSTFGVFAWPRTERDNARLAPVAAAEAKKLRLLSPLFGSFGVMVSFRLKLLVVIKSPNEFRPKRPFYAEGVSFARPNPSRSACGRTEPAGRYGHLFLPAAAASGRSPGGPHPRRPICPSYAPGAGFLGEDPPFFGLGARACLPPAPPARGSVVGQPTHRIGLGYFRALIRTLRNQTGSP